MISNTFINTIKNATLFFKETLPFLFLQKLLIVMERGVHQFWAYLLTRVITERSFTPQMVTPTLLGENQKLGGFTSSLLDFNGYSH
ncbi:hypothetical protein CEXT_508921 [Caerostris extrusa]|uniref:Uncharacterized protein n=1 Tax=Caerostris extrusa TaxID=172846 RepID=A0AAV4MA33_CAEEX|nr:hypothetical protein CEXT_508921 [Caerostris extrusa]